MQKPEMQSVLEVSKQEGTLSPYWDSCPLQKCLDIVGSPDDYLKGHPTLLGPEGSWDTLRLIGIYGLIASNSISVPGDPAAGLWVVGGGEEGVQGTDSSFEDQHKRFST